MAKPATPKTHSIGIVPWMPSKSYGLLGELLASSRRYLEYGAGGSTRFAAAHGVEAITTVESDPAFLKAVDQHIRADAPQIAWQPIWINFKSTGPLGYPKSLRPTMSWIRYPTAPWSAGANPDLILIDGRFRLACALTAACYGTPGTLVFMDDYSLRPWYWTARHFLKPVAKAGRARVFEVTGEQPPLLRHALRRACLDPR